jgi:hypothetical protein
MANGKVGLLGVHGAADLWQPRNDRGEGGRGSGDRLRVEAVHPRGDLGELDQDLVGLVPPGGQGRDRLGVAGQCQQAARPFVVRGGRQANGRIYL